MIKTNILIYYLLIASPYIFSQVTLTSSIDPVPGDIQYFVKADTTGINPGNAGPNQVWNFTNLVKTDSSEVMWVAASSTPYYSNFPQSTMAAIDTCYDYFKMSNSLTEYVGYYSHGTAVPFSNFESILSFPFSYNSTMSDNFGALIPENGDIVIRTGTVSAIADAWGTINTFYGSFQNALRVKEVITIRDSSTTYNIVLHEDFITYDWYVPGRKFSVFSINYFTISFLDFTQTSKGVSYNPQSTLIGITPISTTVPDNFKLFQNYPNPFNPSSKIKFQISNSGDVKLTIFNDIGKEMTTLVNEPLNPGTYQVQWDASNYPSGAYYYRLSEGDFIDTRKMILVK